MASSYKTRVVTLASEWGSKYGGMSTLIRELAIQLAKHPGLQVFIFLPRCSEEDRDAARRCNITLVQAKRLPGYDEEIEWLCSPPDDLQIDFIIGHGVKLGRQAQFIRERCHCKWIQFVHTDPEELGMLKKYNNAIPKGVRKRMHEVELCVMADFVVTVGPKLEDAYRCYLRFCQKDQALFVLTPGIFKEFSDVMHGTRDESKCIVLAFGRSDREDFSLTGYDIAAEAVAKLNNAQLILVGAYDSEEVDVANNLKSCDIPPSCLRVRPFIEDREHLKRVFSEADIAIMPSRTEGYGLAALEALSAGLPVLVSANSGFGEALRKVPFGSGCVIHSEEPEEWAKEIKKVWAKDRATRLQEAKTLLQNYTSTYNWEEQIRDLVNGMTCVGNIEPVLKLKRPSRSNSEDPCRSWLTPNAESSAPKLKKVSTITQHPTGELRSTTARNLVKAGCPLDDDLEELSTMLADNWERLGRRLRFSQAGIIAFHKENERLSDKAYAMLIKWKEREGSDGTYKVLYNALCHKLVRCKLIAEKICCVQNG